MCFNMIEYRKKCQCMLEKREKESNVIANIRLILFLLFLFGAYMKFFKNNSHYLPFLGLIIVIFGIVVYVHKKIDDKILEQKFYLNLIKKYEKRTGDFWKEEINETLENDSLVCEDLNLLRENSLFKYINFTSSLGAKKELVKSLSLENIELSTDTITLKQNAISELSGKIEFVLGFQYVMSSIKNIESIDYKSYFNIFNKKAIMQSWSLILPLLLTVLTWLSVLFYSLEKLSVLFILCLFSINIIYSYIIMIKYKKVYGDIDKCVRNYGQLLKIYQYIEKENFNEDINIDIKSRLLKGKSVLTAMNSVSNLNSFRLNFLSYVFLNGFFSLNFCILYMYNKILEKKIEGFKDSVVALEELEKYISLSTIGIVKVNKCIPKMHDELTLEIENIQHPLLSENICVENNFKCGKDIIIITGSNMSGKTSFIKSVAMNLILAYNGSSVNASKFIVPVSKIFTSINVKDDISKGISTFYGELKRIKNILEFNKINKGSMIVFIDEIFKGTNYNDRILGAKETIKKLSELECIAFITTHDFELCESSDNSIMNIHFSENYKEGKIFFDHKIKQGKCKTTNAKYLMKEIGIFDS